jgi:hypothetical protein
VRAFRSCARAVAAGQGAGGQGFSLAHVQRRRGPVVQPQPGQAQGIFARLQGAQGDLEQLVVGLQVQPGVGHGRDQAGLHGTARLLAGQVLRQSGILEAGDAAEKVSSQL